MDTEAGDRVEEGDPRGERTGDEREEKTSSGGDCFIDIKQGQGGVGRSRNSEKSKEERVCRICHFGKESSSKEMELMSLGCDCKGELGSSHRHCAEAWFSQKGDRECEICGKRAKNISNVNDEEETTSIFMMEWDEMRAVAGSLDASSRESSRRRCKRRFCNVVLACFVLLFLLLWFFRGINI